MFDRSVRFILVLFISAWVVRYLGPEQYGYLSIALALTALVTPVIRLGLDTIIVQHLVNDPAAQPVLLGTTFLLRLIAAILMGAVLVALSGVLYSDSGVIALLTLFLIVGVAAESCDVIDLWNQSQLRSVDTVIARSVAFAGSSALKLAAIFMQAPLEVFGLLYLADSVLYAVLLVLVFKRSGGEIRTWTWDWPLARRLLRLSAPLIISAFAVSLYMRIDQIMLSLMLPASAGERAVGIYSVAVRLSETWYFIPVAIIGSVFPMIIESKQTDEALYRNRMQRLFNILVLLSYSVSLLVMLTAPVIIELLFGAEFLEASAQLIILTWAGVWVCLGTARSYFLHTELRLPITMWTTVMGAVLNIVLNFIFIPSLGGLGCAIATLISQIIASHLGGYFFKSIRFIAQAQTRALFWPNPFFGKSGKDVL